MPAKSSVDVFLRLHNQRKFSKELRTAGTDLEQMGLRGARSMVAFANTGDKLKSFGKSWTRNVTLPVGIGVGLAAKAAIDWESAFAGVRKTVNATEGQFTQMEHGLRSMALQIPVAATDLAGIAEAAGQLGIKRTAILGFTRVIADLGVATNLAGDEGATTLARFANITQMPQTQFDRLGSTIVALGNAGASTEKDIAMMGLRIAAAGNYVGMSEPQILGYANALSSVGIEAEAGGTAISAVFKTINSAVASGGAKLAAFAGVSGESSGAFAKHWKQDAASASVAWIEGLSRLKKEGEDVPALLSALSPKLRGERIQDTLVRAAGAGDLLRESLGLGAKAWQENNALTEEAKKRYATVASKLQKLKNRVIDVGISLGQEILPPLTRFVTFIGPKISDVVTAFGGLSGPVKATALGFLLLTGPVASGLGYFASGVGRTLVLIRKLAAAGTAMQAFSWATQSTNMGLKGSAAYAFGGTGAAAAIQTAKGFAYALGPAFAAVGIANIVSSAGGGEWADAGFKAGGAIVGGILGSVVPGGTLIGVGLGSIIGGKLADKLGEVGVLGQLYTPLVRKIAEGSKETTYWYGEQKLASQALGGAERKLVGAHSLQREAIGSVKRAQQHLTEMVRRYGGDSRPAIRAEGELAQKRWGVVRATQAIKNKERLRGYALSAAKASTRWAIASEKEQIYLLKTRAERLGRLLQYEQRHGASPERKGILGKRIGNVISSQQGEEKKLADVLANSTKEIGPKWTRAMMSMNTASLKFETRPLETKLGHLGDNPGPKKLSEGIQEMGMQGGAMVDRFAHKLKRLNDRARELEQRQLPDFSVPGLTLPQTSSPSGPPAPRRNGPTAPAPRVRKRKGGTEPLAAWSSSTGETVHHTTILLDGKRIAENTTKHANKAANRG